MARPPSRRRDKSDLIFNIWEEARLAGLWSNLERQHISRLPANGRQFHSSQVRYVTPPSAIIVLPVTQPASAEQRNNARPAISPGWPTRASGVEATILA